MSASNTSETIPNEETEKVELEESKSESLKSKLMLKLAYLKELSTKLFKKRQPISSDTDQAEESAETIEATEATIPVQKIGSLLLLQRYRTIIFIVLSILSVIISAFISNFFTSKHYKNQASEVISLQGKVKELNEQLQKNQASINELTSKLLDKETQLKAVQAKSVRSNSNKKGNQVGGNCVLKSGDMAALKDCIDEYNRSHE